MKSAFFGAALLIGTAALAQPAQTPPEDETTTEEASQPASATQPTDQPATASQPMSQPSMATQPMSQPVGQSGSSSGGATVAPGNTSPATDARGIRVISAPAMAPAGWNAALGQASAPASGPAPSMGAATDLPPCSRTVTDRCVQTYERGVARPR